MMKPAAILSRVHKWVGLLVGVQILLWTAGGVVMSVFPIEAVRSEALIAEKGLLAVDHTLSIRPMQAAKAAGMVSLQSMQLESFAGEPVWRLVSEDQTALISARTGESLLPLDEDSARMLAMADYKGKGEMVELVLVQKGPVEVRGRGPLWRARFSRPANYTTWSDPASGKVIAHRSNLWRFYDFFWMLHIMDYDERDNFNNPLLIFFAFSAFLFSITGIAMLVHRIVLRPRRKINL